MFEVGKKYRKHQGLIMTCVATCGKWGWMAFDDCIPSTYEYRDDWKECKEPRTITRWVNVYEKDGKLFTFLETRVHESKETAEKFIVYHNDDVKYVATTSFSYTEPH